MKNLGIDIFKVIEWFYEPSAMVIENRQQLEEKKTEYKADGNTIRLDYLLKKYDFRKEILISGNDGEKWARMERKTAMKLVKLFSVMRTKWGQEHEKIEQSLKSILQIYI